MNTTMKQRNDSQHELEREQEKSRELYKKSVKLESQLASTTGIEVIDFSFYLVFLFVLILQQELTEMNLKLKSELNQVMNEFHSGKQELHQVGSSDSN